MQPIEEHSPSEAKLVASEATPASPSPKKTFDSSTRRSTASALDVPSTKYKEIDEPVNKVVLRRATSPPQPTLPRRPLTRTWNATAKERYPLTSALTGPGRAGKYGELEAPGGKYEGEVLAGRPHGFGRYLIPKEDGSGEMVLQYEGDWVQGSKQGPGTRHFPNGETYAGDFVANARHGQGRYYFANGDIYSGEWVDNRRTGRGTFYYQSGDIFSGNFIKDRKEGMGTLYMVDRQKKYIAEYVSGQPKCGTVLEIDDDDLEPMHMQMRQVAMQKRLDLVASGTPVHCLPQLELLQPNKVLAVEVVAVRKGRAEGTRDLRQVQANSGTLTDKEIEMLRHSYTLMAAGDDIKVGLLPHQLRELCVMAGLDPAAHATRLLVERLLQEKSPTTNRIHFDNFMKVVIHSSTDSQHNQEEDEQDMLASITFGGQNSQLGWLKHTKSSQDSDRQQPQLQAHTQNITEQGAQPAAVIHASASENDGMVPGHGQHGIDESTPAEDPQHGHTEDLEEGLQEQSTDMLMGLHNAEAVDCNQGLETVEEADAEQLDDEWQQEQGQEQGEQQQQQHQQQKQEEQEQEQGQEPSKEEQQHVQALQQQGQQELQEQHHHHQEQEQQQGQEQEPPGQCPDLQGPGDLPAPPNEGSPAIERELIQHSTGGHSTAQEQTDQLAEPQ